MRLKFGYYSELLDLLSDDYPFFEEIMNFQSRKKKNESSLFEYLDFEEDEIERKRDMVEIMTFEAPRFYREEISVF